MNGPEKGGNPYETALCSHSRPAPALRGASHQPGNGPIAGRAPAKLPGLPGGTARPEAAGASAVGINCSVGPDQLVSVVRNIKENVSIPVIAKPNAGMPQIDDLGNAVYSMTPADFAGYMKVLVENGASVIGGCCGTTPEFISETARVLGLR